VTRLPKLKRIITAPDEFLSDGQLKSLSTELLELIPMNGIEGRSASGPTLNERGRKAERSRVGSVT